MFEAVRSVTLPVASASVIPARRAVTIDGNGQIVLAAANATPVGITLEASASGESAAIPVALLDGSKIEIEAGAAVALGAKVAVVGVGADAGRVDDVAAGAAVRYIGVALNAAAAGQVVTIMSASDIGLAQ